MPKLEYTSDWPLTPGQWTWDRKGPEGAPRHGVVICCPQCGMALSAGADRWEIEFHQDGTFTAQPSFHHAVPECGWHVVITRSEY